VLIKERSSAAAVGEVGILRGEEGKGGQRREEGKRRRVEARVLSASSLICIREA
jgi:hypothetical protein